MSILSVFVTSESSSSERRFDKATTVANLREKLEPICGVPASTSKISLYDPANTLIAILDDDSRALGAYPVEDYWRLHVTDTNPFKIKGEYTDVSKVEKFEISEAEYAKRNDSVREFMRRNQMGKFHPEYEKRQQELDEQFAAEAAAISVGDRCQVRTDDVTQIKRGVIRFVGKTDFKPGFWVGVEYDEPIGKHDGSVGGRQYFAARQKHAVIVRPDKVDVGDFPEEDPFADLEE